MSGSIDAEVDGVGAVVAEGGVVAVGFALAVGLGPVLAVAVGVTVAVVVVVGAMVSVGIGVALVVAVGGVVSVGAALVVVVADGEGCVSLAHEADLITNAITPRRTMPPIKASAVVFERFFRSESWVVSPGRWIRGAGVGSGAIAAGGGVGVICGPMIEGFSSKVS